MTTGKIFFSVVSYFVHMLLQVYIPVNPNYVVEYKFIKVLLDVKA